MPQMGDLVRLWIRGGVQPELLVIDSNKRFVDRDLVQSRVAEQPGTGLCT